MITELKSHQIFIYGSNLKGWNAGGSAKQAQEQFGAKDGIGEGLNGQCYAFPTLTEELKQRTGMELRESVEKLYSCCRENPYKEFLLTKVGCGIAGYNESFIKSLFVDSPSNLTLPTDWK